MHDGGTCGTTVVIIGSEVYIPKFKILDKSVCISYCLRKGMNPSILPLAMDE